MVVVDTIYINLKYCQNLEAYNTLHFRSVVCDYHGQIECTVCAPAIAQRQAFIVCDFGCQGLDLRPVEGCHLPYGALNRSRRDSIFGGGDTSSARLDATFSQIAAFG